MTIVTATARPIPINQCRMRLRRAGDFPSCSVSTRSGAGDVTMLSMACLQLL
jgi:hypothetical protein